MTLTDVENLTAAELKAKRSEIVKSIEGEKVPVEDLITRYLQARLDAKVRDEKLAGQGATITALQQGLTVATEKVAGLESKLNVLGMQNVEQEARHAAVVDGLEQKVTELEKVVADTRTANSQLVTTLKEAQALAKARRKALADVAGVINPLLVQE